MILLQIFEEIYYKLSNHLKPKNMFESRWEKSQSYRKSKHTKISYKKDRQNLWKPSKTHFQQPTNDCWPTAHQTSSPCWLWFTYRFWSASDMTLKLFWGASAHQNADGKNRRPPKNVYKTFSSTRNVRHSFSRSKNTSNSFYELVTQIISI